MKELIKKSRILWLLILAVSFFGCEEDDDASLPEIVASFIHTIDEDKGVVVFENLSENANSYVWNFGDGTTSNLINPVKVYPTGTYTITLEASNTAGASATFEDQIVINIPLPINFPVNFDDPNVNYDVGTFNGTSFAIVANPDPSGSNTSTSNVGAITNSGAAFEGVSFDLGMGLDLSTLKTVKANFWSNTPVDILLKLEQGTGGDIEVTASHGGTGWEEVYFTFDSANTYSRVTIFVDGPGTTAGTFYVDDISQIDTADIPCTETELKVPIDFDCEGIDYASKIVGNVSFTVVDNPQQSGINDQDTKVGQITNVGAQWENAFFNFDTAIDFSVNKGVRMKLFSDQALPILLKFEDGTEAPVENAQNHGGTGWEELTFTLESSASYNDMVLFIDGPGTAAGTFYVDDIEQVSVTPVDPCTPETSQSLGGADFNLTFQTDPTASIGSFDAGLSWIDNPDFNNDVNKSCKVGQIDRSGAALFANNQIDVDSKFDFNANSGFKMKVWAANAGTKVLVKLEDQADAGINTEVEAVTTTASAWEELTFNFAPGESGKYDKIILFFELNTNTTATYYIDDFALYSDGSGGGGSTAKLLDFEDNLAGVTAGEFETSGALIANPVSGGINTSANVYEAAYTNSNQWWGGVGFVFDAGLDQATTVYKGKFYSTVAPTNVLFQVEVDGTGPTVGQVQEITTANEWVELTFTLDNIPPGVNRILVRPDVGNQDGTKPNTGSLYIDDIEAVDGGSGGGGSGACPEAPAGELLSNGGFEANDGDGACWQLNAGGTNQPMISNAEANSGTYSVKITTGPVPNHVPNIKAERIGTSVAGGKTIEVSFRYKITTAFVDGSILQVLAFSERSVNGAVPHDLGNAADTGTAGDWLTYTGTFVTDAAIDEGISLLIQATCGGAPTCAGEVFIDDVVVKEI